MSQAEAAAPKPPAEAAAAAEVEAAAAISGPELPPKMKRTMDEVIADLETCPLFMTELDEDNEAVQALQALSYEGTPLENGADFKEEGNGKFKLKRWADARDSYGKGIEILALEERKRRDAATSRQAADAAAAAAEADGEQEVEQQRALLTQLYVNRAASHLWLQNYRSCTLDCAAALRLDPANTKALYRSARALLAVDRIDETLDVCRRGLRVDPGNGPLRVVEGEARTRADALARRDAERAGRESLEKRRERRVRAAIRARGIRTRATAKPPEMEDAGIRLVPDPDGGGDADASADAEQSALVFPAVLLYPAHYQSDFIKAFGEHDTLEDHLAYVLPPPWDEAGEYAAATDVECYVQTAAPAAAEATDGQSGGGVMRVGKRVPLGRVLGTGRIEVVDQIVKLYVLPRARAEGWVREHKEMMAKAGE